MDRRLLWGIVGLFAYLGAAFALAMAVSPYIGANGFPDFLPTGETFGLLIVSLMLFGLGAFSLRRASDRPTAVGERRMGKTATMDDDDEAIPIVECEECGTVNEAIYRYCEECAERL